MAEIRSRYPFSFSKSRLGRWHLLRVYLILLTIVALTWYGKHGTGLFTNVRLIRVAGEGVGGGYSVFCLSGRDTTTISEVAVLGALPSAGELPRPDSVVGAAIFWESVYPFGDSVKAVLLTAWGSTALLCDSLIFEEQAGRRAQARFWEKLDLLVIPPAGEAEILTVREQFRPRLLAAVPPCDSVPSMPNIICNAAPNSEFRYNFAIKRGRLGLVD